MVIVFGTMRSNQSDEALPFSGDGWNAIQKPMERCQGFVFSLSVGSRRKNQLEVMVSFWTNRSCLFSSPRGTDRMQKDTSTYFTASTCELITDIHHPDHN